MSASKVTLTLRGLLEWQDVHLLLQTIVYEVADLWWDDDIEMGDIHRTQAENDAVGSKSTVHVVGPPFRAVDIRTRIEGGDFQAKADAVAAKINARWIYDPARPKMVVAYSDVHGTGPHLHVQVHPNTRLRLAPGQVV